MYYPRELDQIGAMPTIKTAGFRQIAGLPRPAGSRAGSIRQGALLRRLIAHPVVRQHDQVMGIAADDDARVGIAASHDRERLAADLRGAVDRGEIIAYYQPQFAVDTRRIVSAEALSRWLHPELGVILPGDFIPIAEEHGLIGDIGDHMIGLGCRSAADWLHKGDSIEVAVNVSAIQLRDAGFADRLVGAIQTAGLDPQLLTIEVTESTAIIDVSSVAERLDWLRSVGVTISVDDFGTGHSSVERVIDLRAKELKIDQGLVQDDSTGARILLGAVVAFAHDKGLRVVAEGVETEDQLDRVRELRCDRAQGYLLGRPVPRAEFDRLLAAS
jgi:EAL domain-containing protein (putative c-di-GMP-specific phosphodiesterase class I)